MTLMEEVTALQVRVAEAQRAKARAEGARDTAQAAADHAREELAAEFGVTTVEQAEELLARYRDDLEKLTAAITAKLDEIGV